MNYSLKFSKKFLFSTVGMLAFTGTVLLPACETISEQDCLAGNWEEIGYKDGVNGVSRARIADYADTCSEYGASVNRQSYLAAYENGLQYYCTYDKGFALGENGSSYRSVCDGPGRGLNAADFRAGYEDGRAEYEIRKQYDSFQNEIKRTEAALLDVTERLKNKDLSPEEQKRLARKQKRLINELDDLRFDFRRFRRDYGLY